MADQCKFPACNFHAEANGYCCRHKIYAGVAPTLAPPVAKVEATVGKVRKPIAKVAAKRKVINRTYNKLVDEMLKENPKCEIKSPVCTGNAQGLNHKQKRSPNNLIKKENLERACNACNGYCEKHPKWAEKNGHQISRFKK